MGKQLTLAQMFRYCPGTVNLVGFPNSSVLKKLGTTLGQEALLRTYQTEVEGKKVVMPSFPPKYVAERQKLFQQLPKGLSLTKSVFEREFPKKENSRCSPENFLYFCESVYETLEAVRNELRFFKHLPEARSVLKRLQNFDGGLEETLRALKAVEDSHTFAIDTKSGVIVNIDRMPSEANDAVYLAHKSGRGREGSLDRVKIKMKKAALNISRQGKDDFKRRTIRFVRDEFGYNPEVKNVRADFEQLAVPVRLHTKYKRFLDKCVSNIERALDSGEFDGFLPEIASPIYPQFGGNYDIKNLFPPSLLDEWEIPEEVVPINFKTKPNEEKILIGGLHSGGKSFFLTNLVLASISGQVPLPICSDPSILPRYNRIFYYRNVYNSGTDGSGKAMKELRDINLMINNAGKGDLLVFDEFLDSTTAEVATWLGPELLGRLSKLKDTTVFVSSHRSHNYKELEKNGWVIMSPEHRIEYGRVVPAHSLKRGWPNEIINGRYVREKYESQQKG